VVCRWAVVLASAVSSLVSTVALWVNEPHGEATSASCWGCVGGTGVGDFVGGSFGIGVVAVEAACAESLAVVGGDSLRRDLASMEVWISCGESARRAGRFRTKPCCCGLRVVIGALGARRQQRDQSAVCAMSICGAARRGPFSREGVAFVRRVSAGVGQLAGVWRDDVAGVGVDDGAEAGRRRDSQVRRAVSHSVQNSPDAVFVVDPVNGELLEFNDRLRRC